MKKFLLANKQFVSCIVQQIRTVFRLSQSIDCSVKENTAFNFGCTQLQMGYIDEKNMNKTC